MIKKCEYCGKEFETKHSEQKCCSRECDSKKRSIAKVKLECPICGKIFYKKASDIKNVKGKPCCSLECSRINRQKYQDINKAIEICKMHNDNLFITNKSGHRGVYFYKNKWTAFYNHKYIGRFDTFNEAVQARLNAEQDKKKAS